MSNPDWFYDTGAVVEHPETGAWWHIIGRLRDVDTGSRFYRLADATHTEYMERTHADYVEGEFESLGWSTDTKPAAENGFRVNGVLCGPQDIDHYKGKKCVHERQCSECGMAREGYIDIIHSFEDGELHKTMLECRSCGNCWEETND